MSIYITGVWISVSVCLFCSVQSLVKSELSYIDSIVTLMSLSKG